MGFIADYDNEFETWDYILGDISQGMSIATDRYEYLMDINYDNPIKISLKDPENDYWTKWEEFPGKLWEKKINDYGSIQWTSLTAAIDVHRSMLGNEIIIESDYPSYEENYKAAKAVGIILENKGFIPHYYYSGNKSVHVHVFFNWDCLQVLDEMMQDRLKVMFRDSKTRFKKKFIEWLRTKMISCWDTNIKKFDKDLIKGTHLIRCELSKNKLGYKTFLGYTYKDMSFIPYICNEKNLIYPKLGEIKLSAPDCIHELIDEFIGELETQTKREKRMKTNKSLGDWMCVPKKVRECVKAILSNDFKKSNDGFKRGMFILLNELRAVFGDAQARIVINDWNARMDFPVKEHEIEYRFKSKQYSLSCKYIHEFLKDIGINMVGNCYGKL